MSHSNYPGNSNKARDEKSDSQEQRPKMQKIVKTAALRPPSIGRRIRDTFAGGEDAQSVGSYILFQVIIPTAKDMLFNAVSEGTNRMLWGGDVRPRQAGYSSGSRTSYSEISTAKAKAKNNYPGRNFETDGGRPLSSSARSRHNFDEILFDTRGEAEMVIDTMQDLISRFDWVSVTEFYELCDITGTFQDEKWGWSNISTAQIRPTRGRYVLLLPSPEHDG